MRQGKPILAPKQIAPIAKPLSARPSKVDPERLTCPNMSMVEYARYFGRQAPTGTRGSASRRKGGPLS